MSTSISISSTFDSGNIIVEECAEPEAIRLSIRRDHQSDFYQWFHFRLTGAAGTPCRMTITNAGGSAYPKGWEGYHALASEDGDHWFRVPTRFDGEALTIEHTPRCQTMWYAYFAPFDLARHRALVGTMQQRPGVVVTSLGLTHDGRDLDLVHLSPPQRRAPDGAPDGAAENSRLACWIIARQHPGETMAEWAAEGLLKRLTDLDDPVTRLLRARCDFYVVPNMNPDGSARGHLRTNAKGVNLNREWNKADPETGPEVYYVLERMKETGVDFFLDCHGDENLPYNFIAGGEGAPSFTDHQQALLDAYKEALMQANPDFQTTHGYPVDARGSANMSVATNYISEAFGCLAMTLEMPFKDNADLPDPAAGWSPARSAIMGESQLDALYAVLGNLRGPSPSAHRADQSADDTPAGERSDPAPSDHQARPSRGLQSLFRRRT